MDKETRRDIDSDVAETLRDAGLVAPPVQCEPLLDHLKLHRGYYDLQDPAFLDRVKYKTKVHGMKLVRILRSIKLSAVLLYDENRIVLDKGLKPLRRIWPTFHEMGHRIIGWHRPSFNYGDTAKTLDPSWHEQLEAEANYAASALMFCGKLFTSEALDTPPEWNSVADLSKRYDKSLLTTLRRYVEHSHDRPMAMLVSTAPWMEKPVEQAARWRHFVLSERMVSQFSAATAHDLLGAVNGNITRRRGGPVADFCYYLNDDNDVPHEFRVESFFNGYDVLTFFVELRSATAKRIVVVGTGTEGAS